MRTATPRLTNKCSEFQHTVQAHPLRWVFHLQSVQASFSNLTETTSSNPIQVSHPHQKNFLNEKRACQTAYTARPSKPKSSRNYSQWFVHGQRSSPCCTRRCDIKASLLDSEGFRSSARLRFLCLVRPKNRGRLL